MKWFKPACEHDWKLIQIRGNDMRTETTDMCVKCGKTKTRKYRTLKKEW